MEGLEKKDTYEQKMIALERELEELEKKRNERKARREKRLAELKVKENEIEELRRGLSKRAASPTNRNFFKQKEGKPDEQVEGYGVNMYNSDVLKKTKPENFKNPQNNSTISEKELKKYSGRAEDGKSQSVINFSKYKVSKETNISTTGFDDKLKTKKKLEESSEKRLGEKKHSDLEELSSKSKIKKEMDNTDSTTKEGEKSRGEDATKFTSDKKLEGAANKEKVDNIKVNTGNKELICKGIPKTPELSEKVSKAPKQDSVPEQKPTKREETDTEKKILETSDMSIDNKNYELGQLNKESKKERWEKSTPSPKLVDIKYEELKTKEGEFLPQKEKPPRTDWTDSNLTLICDDSLGVQTDNFIRLKKKVPKPRRNNKSEANAARLLHQREITGAIKSGYADDANIPKPRKKVIESLIRPHSSSFAEYMDILDKGENLFDSENKQKLSKFGLSPEVITGKKILGAIKKGTHELKSTKDQFKHEPILLKLKGKKKIRVSEVEINIQSLNHYDVFILDDGKGTLFLFKGRNARRLIHGYAVNLCQKMKDQDYAGRGKVVNVEDDGINSTIKSEQSFWEALKGDKSNIPDVDDDADEIYERNYMESRDFYEKESDNEFHSKKLASPSRKMLNNSKCYIIKCGEALYIWNGANADIETRKECADFATQLQSKITSRSWAPVRTIIDKGEPTYFREFFSDWSDQSTFSAKPAFGQKNLGVSTVEKKSITEIDVNEMLKEDTKLITALDDGTGSLKVWHCTEKVITEIKEIEFGQFFAEESYLVLYKRSDKAEEFILYIWRGAKGRPNDLGAAGVQACSINQEYGAKHINIEQNKENEHFLKIFEKRNGFCVEEGSRYLDKKIDRLYKVLENSNGCRACYIIKKFSSLSSNATFIAVSKDKTWIWKGDGSSNTVIGYAHKVAKLVSHVPPIELHEGNESKEFIDFFGSKESYGNDLFLKEPGMSKYLRMWHISQHVGEPKTQELEQPTQKDFESQAVYIIDCFYAIFVWVGSNASQYGYQLAIKTAHNLEQHVKKKEVARNKFNMRATIVYSGEEPLSFKALFITWNDEKTKKKIKKGANENIYRKTASAYVAEALQELQGGKKYAAEELGVDLAKLPPGVDPAKREDSLQDDEFEKAFKMSKEKYYALPQWKQLQIKRSSNLF